MSTYEATQPPENATCDTPGCGSVAKVRMIIPKSLFTADGVDHSQDPPTFDACELHWPGIRDTCMRNGHAVVDVTGDLRELMGEFPRWTVFTSDGGWLYASARVGKSKQGVTVHAYLVGQLRREILAMELFCAQQTAIV